MRCNNIIYRRLLVSSCLQFIIDLISNNRVSQYYCHGPRPNSHYFRPTTTKYGRRPFPYFQDYRQQYVWSDLLPFFGWSLRGCQIYFPQQLTLISVPYIIRLPSIMRCGNVITCLIVHTPIKWLISGETCLVLIGRRAFIPRRTVEFVCLTTKPVTSCLCARCSRTFCCCSKVCVTLNLWKTVH